MKFILQPGKLTLDDLRVLLQEDTTLTLDPQAIPAIVAAEKKIADVAKKEEAVYGVNTGFGALANFRIQSHEIEILQERIVLSHAAGVGEPLDDKIVRLILILKINSLARGYSGIKLSTLEALIQLFNARIYPCIPAKGSVGASGDLAPLAHLSLALLGIGEVRFEGKMLAAKTALAKIDLAPLVLGAKEGLALLNGTQVSTALAIIALLETENIFSTALITGALSVEAVKGSRRPFDKRIQVIRGHAGQEKVAAWLTDLLANSEIQQSHFNCEKVQDPYSLRCQPQVMGACLSHLLYALNILITETNAVSDNPLVFVQQDEILSGGNFHAAPIGFAADTIAVALAEISSLAERRIALLMDPHFSHLPAFLVNNAGINSGFMLAQVTAAALTSENKSLAYPGSVDNIPTSANQEDHVSMATYAARRLLQMTENATSIIAIELLCACQGIDFLRPLKTSILLEKIHALLRTKVNFYAEDRYLAPDIAAAKQLIQSETIRESIKLSCFE